MVISPEIGADRTLTLRYLAPNATQVTVNGELDGKPHPMTKGADGIWTVTIGPLAPDIYTYTSSSRRKGATNGRCGATT